MINRGPSATPPTFMTRMRTNAISTVTTAAGGVGNWTIKINSCFDPTGNMSAAQPSGYDQIAGVLYNNYMVTFAVIDIELMNTSSASLVWAAYLADADTVVTSVLQAAEQPYAKTHMLGVSGSGNNRMRFRFAVKPTTIIGRNKPINDQMADVTADPADIVNLHIIFQDTAQAAVAVCVNRAVITQYVRFSDRVVLPLS